MLQSASRRMLQIVKHPVWPLPEICPETTDLLGRDESCTPAPSTRELELSASRGSGFSGAREHTQRGLKAAVRDSFVSANLKDLLRCFVQKGADRVAQWTKARAASVVKASVKRHVGRSFHSSGQTRGS